jgi:hypothetical protein
MKRAAAVILLLLIAVVAFPQTKPAPLPKEEMSKMTQDQRFIHESGRKSKKDGRTSVKKKAKIQKKTNRKSERIRAPKRKKRVAPK